jgi:hypothetical protein
MTNENYDFSRAFEVRLDAQRTHIEKLREDFEQEMTHMQQALEDIGHALREQSVATGLVHEETLNDAMDLLHDEMQVMENEIKRIDRKLDVDRDTPFKFPAILVYPVLMALLLLVMVTAGIRIWNLVDDDTVTVSDDAADTNVVAQQTLDRANDAVASVELVLSFLEGASVLVAVALGAAALYGVRQTNQIRVELRDDLAHQLQELDNKRIDDRRTLEDVRRTLERIRRYEPRLERLDKIEIDLLNKTREVGDEVRQKSLSTVGKLLQADQEFRLRNYKLSYQFIQEVLTEEQREAEARRRRAAQLASPTDVTMGATDADMPPAFASENPLTLYLAGWIETQHIDGLQDLGLEHLEQLVKLQPRWPSALAVYGVALRRAGMRNKRADGSPDPELMNMARGFLYQALGRDDDLVDFNRESYWGPLGGLLRDIGEIDQAIAAYRNARRVTPGSSYPAGNLAALLLRKAKDDPRREAEALEAFAETIKLAEGELANQPNDYFLIMDLAMARTVLGTRTPALFDDAERNLRQVLQMRLTREHLNVSIRGWSNLLEYAPRSLEWRDARARMEDAYHRLEEARDTAL